MAQRSQKHKEKKTIVKENIKAKFLCYFSMLGVSIIFSAVWALVRWVWLEFGFFPNVKTATAEIVIPIILSIIYYIVTLISSRKYSIEKFVRGSASFLSLALFIFIGFIVESRMNKIVDIQSITPAQKNVMEKADYIHVRKLSIDDLDKNQHGRYIKHSISGRYFHFIRLHDYEVYALHSIPNAFIGHHVTSEEHNYPIFDRKKELEKLYRDFWEQQSGHLLRRLNMNDIYLKRLLPKDYVEGFQHAMGNVSKKYRQVHQDQTIIYEIVFKPLDTSFHASMWLIVLLIEAILLTIAFRLALDKKE